MNKAAVLIPVYKKQLNDNEYLALNQCFKILSKHKIIFFASENLETNFYEEFCLENNIKFEVERFEDKYFNDLWGYNELLKNENFYKRFLNYEYILIYQLDAFVFKDELIYWCNKGYDYIGAPWFEGFGQATENNEMLPICGNGGFSLRKTKTFYDLFSIIQKDITPENEYMKSLVDNKKASEDLLICTVFPKYFKNLNIAKSEEAKYFSFECLPKKLYEEINYQLPFGCHSWEKYDSDFWKEFIKTENNNLKNFDKKTVESYEESLMIDYYLGDKYLKNNNFIKAVEHLKKALEILNNLSDLSNSEKLTDIKLKLTISHDALAQKAFNDKDFSEAINNFKESLFYSPDNHIIYFNIGLCFYESGETNFAVKFLEKSIQLNSGHKDAHKLLADIYYHKKSYFKAMKSYEAYWEFDNNDLNINKRLGHICSITGYTDKCLKYFNKAVQLNPTSPTDLNNLLISSLKNPAFSQKDIYNLSKNAVENYLKISEINTNINVTHKNIPEKNKKIHIGYLSADFYSHAVIRFFEPVLINYDKNRFSVTCYSNVQNPDHITQRCRGYVDNFKEVKNLNDKELAELIKNDEIDILVDLSGHSGSSRILAMAYKPAPIQITYLGYPNTSGLSTIDYILTDKMTIIDGDKAFLEETPYALEFGYECYNYNEKIFIDVEPLPAIKNDYVTFGYFNCLSKFNYELMKIFAEVLNASPTSKLLIHRLNLDEDRINQLYKEFNELGIGNDRLIIKNDKDKVLEIMNTADVALDAFPYNGTTTTIDSIIMGLPVVCIYGDAPHSRASARINTVLGLEELIAKDKDEFIKITAELANDREKLCKLREGLRHRLINSRLTDHRSFVSSLEKTYIQMWQVWCDNKTALSSGA